jgi:rhodanese-related sulfurtransferase
MKELEKTKRISIAAVLTILLVLVALLSYKRPAYMYTQDINDALESVTSEDYFVNYKDLKSTDYALIDLRSQIDFEKGHIEDAINIYAPEILTEDNFKTIKTLQEDSKTIAFYGYQPNEAIAPFMILKQLGIENIKILKSNLNYNQDELVVSDATVEDNLYDVNKFIAESVKKAAVKPKPKPKPVVKKVVPKKKKKKMPVEGGC